MSTDPAPGYAELHCLSNFSFLRGASHPEELVLEAAKLGYAAIALTDECSLAGIVRAHLAAREGGIRLIVGAEVRFSDGPKLVLLATDRPSYGRLSALITRGRRAAEKGDYQLARADLDGDLDGCLALLIPGSETARCFFRIRLLKMAGSGKRRRVPRPFSRWPSAFRGARGSHSSATSAPMTRRSCIRSPGSASKAVYRWWLRVTCTCTSVRGSRFRIR